MYRYMAKLIPGRVIDNVSAVQRIEANSGWEIGFWISCDTSGGSILPTASSLTDPILVLLLLNSAGNC